MPRGVGDDIAKGEKVVKLCETGRRVVGAVDEVGRGKRWRKRGWQEKNEASVNAEICLLNGIIVHLLLRYPRREGR